MAVNACSTYYATARSTYQVTLAEALVWPYLTGFAALLASEGLRISKNYFEAWTGFRQVAPRFSKLLLSGDARPGMEGPGLASVGKQTNRTVPSSNSKSPSLHNFGPCQRTPPPNGYVSSTIESFLSVFSLLSDASQLPEEHW
jgi:hypothetical protein